MSLSRVWRSTHLEDVALGFIKSDPDKMQGYARFLAKVTFCWTYQVERAAAGHGFIFVNPLFWETIPEETQKTVIVHEADHLILRHLERGKDLNQVRFNCACDYVINWAITQDGFTWEGFDPLLDSQFRHMSAEEAYAQLGKNKKSGTGAQFFFDPDAHVPNETIEDMVEEMAEQLEEEVEDVKTIAKLDAASAAGDLQGNSASLLEYQNRKIAMVGATYPFIFKKYLTEPLSSGLRTFRKASRRVPRSTGIILPGNIPKRGGNNRLQHLTYALDVSGSISEDMRQSFYTSGKTIKEIMNPATMTLLFFDTRIVKEITLTDRDRWNNMVINAGGGTDLGDVYRRCSQLNTEALVIFTDLAVLVPPKPDYDVIWFLPKCNASMASQATYGDVYIIPE